MPDASPTALSGIRVLELGSFIAGPFAGQLLGDLGAEVIKIEPPGTGDAMRTWGVCVDGRGLWWPAIARNKRSVAVDLRDERGRDVVRRIARRCDIVLENFTPGRLAAWGLSYADLAPENRGLVMVHVSGFGQTGPYAHRPGFGNIGEAMGGLRHVTGYPDRPPSRLGISIGDALAALFAVVGSLAALHERSRSGEGQEVDVAIYEAVFALMESTLADHALAGVTRARPGAALPAAAPSNVYPTADGGEVMIAANADPIFSRLCELMGRPELAGDPRFATNGARGANMPQLDGIIGAWTTTFDRATLTAALEERAIPFGAVYTAAEMLADDHIAAREMVVRLTAGFTRDVPMAGVVPKLSRTPGRIDGPGPVLGADTASVLTALAGLDGPAVDALRAAGIVEG